MKIRDIIDMALTVLITMILLWLFIGDAEASYRRPLQTRSNSQYLRRIGQANRREATLLNHRNYYESAIQQDPNNTRNHRGYSYYENRIRDNDMRREAMVQMLIYPDIIRTE